MRTFASSALVFLGWVGVQSVGCSNSADDCAATGTCGSSAGTPAAGASGKPTGGSGADGGGSGMPNSGGSSNLSGAGGAVGTAGALGAGGDGGAGSVPCTGDVSDDAVCWTTNEHGVFVSSESGNDAQGDGTREAPYATLSKGVAASGGKKVFVCLGLVKDEYAERLTLSELSDGVRIYGGFDCATWDYSVTRKASVVSPGVIALRIQGLKKGAYIENLRFAAADGAGADASSYGAFITDSQKVELKRVELTAGAGLSGGNGKDGAKGADGAAATASQNGKPALCGGTPPSADGGVWDAPICGARGGDGGKAVLDNPGGSGFSGTPVLKVTPPNNINLGAGSSDAQPGGSGTDGSTGNVGSLGAAAPGKGGFTANGFTPAAGQQGGAGFPGQGGGGGGASKGSLTCRGASGGAGGMGGCGGPPGSGGGGGGASVGLLSWSSQVTLTSCVVKSATGGAGGKGGKGGVGGIGAEGGVGGNPDLGQAIAKGGRGGAGGNGGNGGSGSGGTGGPSYALVYSGIKPVYAEPDTTLTPGKGGAAGAGGEVLAEKAPSGSIGESTPVLEVK